MFEQFGGKITPAELEKLQKSPQWDGKKFLNELPTGMDFGLKHLPKLLYETFTKRKSRAPQQDLGFLELNLQKLNAAPAPKFAWFGHSAALLQLEGLNFLIDPMLGDDASPIGPLRTKRYSKNVLSVVNQLPPITAVFLTHDHYDHLDYKSIMALKNKVNKYHVALGVKRHLEAWGISSNQITEYDWWDTGKEGGVQFTFTPSRHFSGRGLSDRAKSLWGGWVFQSQSHQIYWSGDGGYGPHFKTIGDRFGMMDWGFMECGQYNTLWEQIHLLPNQTAQATADAKVKTGIPVHWGAFSLALHHWTDPVTEYLLHSENLAHNVLTPRIGQVVELGEAISDKWWEKIPYF